ncbi:NUMOD3 domain-containing DNA-binding protein [Campylobacter coli]|uniref:NUMOD3 domain-containing DNA-binding protein n=1 Tax=Campylobacter coli TaxID=195 RepID=UPI0007110556|nr:NUMOD3 domain-containing DNA-binding protein [Campylobacter coli]
MFHYTYLIEYTTGKKYMGVRSSKVPPEEDTKYVGSSLITPNDKILRKIILQQFETRQEALQSEIEYHKKYDVAVNTDYYNRARQTSTGFDVTGTKFTKEHREKIGKSNLGKIISEETRRKLSIAHKGKRLGWKHSEETRNKISKANKGTPPYSKGLHFSEDYIREKYESRTKFPNTKFKWINTRINKIVYMSCRELGYKVRDNKGKPTTKYFTAIVQSYNTKYNRVSYLGWRLHKEDK